MQVPVYSVLFSTIPSPIGTLLLTSQQGLLTGLYVQGEKHSPTLERHWIKNDQAFDSIVHQLEDYFLGLRFQFEVPRNAAGSEFQKRVWTALCEIPFGRTWTYGDLASRIGNRNASRAVGLANGRNPISIIVPCHRVIGADGSLTGYGGGLAAKKWLLDHEKKFLRVAEKSHAISASAP